MGQAKRRGTFEERKAAAIAKKDVNNQAIGRALRPNCNGIGVVGTGYSGKSMLMQMAHANQGPLTVNQNDGKGLAVNTKQQVRIPTKKG